MANAEAVLVWVKGNHLAHRIDQSNPGRIFRLSDMFSEGAQQLGNDKFSAVLFTTRSGNMYLLTDNGILVNRGESIRTGKLHITELEHDEWLLETELTIGYSFFFRHRREGVMVHGNTSALAEIVPFLHRIYSDEYLADKPYCDAIERFDEGMFIGGDVRSLMLRITPALA